MSPRATVAESLRALGRGLREPRFYMALLVALIAWTAAYQYKRDYTVEVADLRSTPYLSGFNDIEKSTTDPTLSYRWSKGSAEVDFPGIGNQPVQITISTIGARPNGEPPAIMFTARGEQFTLQTQAGEHSDTFFVDRGTQPLDGDLDIHFSVPAFTPPGDARELGVIIRRVVVQPADYGVRPPVFPPVGTLGLLMVGLVGLYGLFLLLSRRRTWALGAVWAGALLATLGILFARPDLALLADELPVVLAWAIGLGLAAQGCMALLLRRGSEARYPVPLALALLAFAFAFMLRFGGLIYPQFLTSDLLLHVHNVQDVLGGNLVFTEPLPDGRAVPYPPAYYLLVSALSIFTGNSDAGLGLALKWSASVLDAVACLALLWAGSHVWTTDDGRRTTASSRRSVSCSQSGALAALAYLAVPGVFDLFSAGNYTNLFGQSVLNITLLGGLIYLADRGGLGRAAPLLLALGFGLTMLGHYGMMLGTLGILGIFALWTLIITLRKSGEPARAWILLGAGGAALLGSFVLYYWRFLENIAGQFGDFFGKLGGTSSSPVSATGDSVKPSFGESVLKLPGKAGQLLGGLTAITGLAGVALLPRTMAAVRALLLSWLAATLVFALLDQAVGDSVRWYYLGAVPLALLAGRFLSLLAARRGPARLITALLVAVTLLQMLTYWVGLIYTRYH
ncbi:MAG TPA: hypothetical protein VLQ48_13730 [Chloroflexia bacterium]|nr:hypothetical protein [Chloroflexia bacterium]